jgi:integrative and conjugative element protein (TIGR02256 family)
MRTFAFKKHKIVFSDAVLETFNKYKQKSPQSHESGGIVLGQITGDVIYINRASTPNIFDKSSRYRFERDKNAAQIIVNYEYNNSDRKISYLGEWHTHPENTPTPSGQDRKMIKDQYSSSKLNEPFLLMIIQGIENLYVAYFDGMSLTECNEI